MRTVSQQNEKVTPGPCGAVPTPRYGFFLLTVFTLATLITALLVLIGIFVADNVSMFVIHDQTRDLLAI